MRCYQKNFKDPIEVAEFEIDGFDMLLHPNVKANVGRGSILYVHTSKVQRFKSS